MPQAVAKSNLRGMATSKPRLQNFAGVFLLVIAIGIIGSLTPALSHNFPRAKVNLRRIIESQINSTASVRQLWNRTKTATKSIVAKLVSPALSTEWRDGYEAGFKAGYDSGVASREEQKADDDADDERDKPLLLPPPAKVPVAEVLSPSADKAAGPAADKAAGGKLDVGAGAVSVSDKPLSKAASVAEGPGGMQTAASKTVVAASGGGSEESCVPEAKDPWPFYRISDDEDDKPSTPLWPAVGWKWLDVDNEAFRTGLKFYMYEEDPFDIDRLARCFLDKHKIPHDTTHFREWDDALSLVVRLYIPELRVWPVLRNHSMRTLNPEEAGLFIVGYSPLVGQMASPCDGETSDQWEIRVAQALKESKWYKRNKGADHLMFWMKYNQGAVQALTDVLNEGSLIATTDRYFWNVYRNIPKPFKEGTVVIMPYLDSSYIDVPGTDLSKDLVKKETSRYFFRGILKRRFGKRGTLLELQTMLNGTLFLDKKMPYKPMPDMLVDNAKEIFESQMCMCPQGDAPTSGRVFEAVAAACVPIIISPRGLMPTNMPFPSLIRWDEISLFSDNFEAVTAKPDGLAAFAKVLEELPKERLECMQRKARRVYFERMSYFHNPLGVTEGMLFEIWVMLQKRHLIPGPLRDAVAVSGLRNDKYSRSKQKARMRRFLRRRRRRRVL